MQTFSTLIIADGDIPTFETWQPFVQHNTTSKLICTDGAAVSLSGMGVQPDVIIGDFDTLLRLYKTHAAIQDAFPGAILLPKSDQESTDFEKALNYVADHHSSSSDPILCLGLFGQALDHTLYNLCLLAKYKALPPLIWMQALDETHREWGFLLPQKCCIYTEPGASISFFPLPSCQITSQGLQWELNATNLAQLGRHSVRNQAKNPKVILSTEGECFIIIGSREPPICIINS